VQHTLFSDTQLLVENFVGFGMMYFWNQSPSWTSCRMIQPRTALFQVQVLFTTGPPVSQLLQELCTLFLVIVSRPQEELIIRQLTIKW